METAEDEFLRVEMHRLTCANLSYTSGTQHGYCGWVESKEMQSPSVWTTTLCPIEVGAKTVVQQALPEEVAMTIWGEALSRQRDRSRLDVALE